MKILGHRGASASAPENTAPAFLQAIREKADGVELDVHLTSDGKMVLHHDFKINDTSNGAGLIGRQTLQQLRALDFGAWKGPAFAGTSILTLEEALELVKDMAVINIELKSGKIPYPDLPALACGLVKRMGLTDKVILSSFDHTMAMEAKRSLPAVRVGLLYKYPLLRPVALAKRLGADALHPRRNLVTKGLVERAHQAGLAVNVWTVNSPIRAKKLRDWGCDAVICNSPGEIRAALETNERP